MRTQSIITFLGLLMVSLPGRAQLKADEGGVCIKGGTDFSVDGLILIPDNDLVVKSLILSRDNISTAWPQFSSVKRRYRLSVPVVFSGKIGMNFTDTELNGNSPEALALAYSEIVSAGSFKDYSLYQAGVINLEKRTISGSFSEGIHLAGLTAVTPGITIPPVNASPGTSICEGSSLTLSTVQAASWQWYHNGTVIPGGNRQDLVVSEAGDYTVLATFANGVKSVSDQINVSVESIPEVSVSCDKGEKLSLGDKAILTVSGGKSYTWVDEEGILSGQTASSITVRPSKTTTYKVLVGNGSSCKVVKSFSVKVEEDYKTLIPNNFLTPNGDGANDTWIINNIDMYPNNEVEVFDRAGRVVYYQTGYKNNWDGSLNGKQLAEDTYYFVLIVNSGKKKISGYISIVKE